MFLPTVITLIKVPLSSNAVLALVTNIQFGLNWTGSSCHCSAIERLRPLHS